MGPKAKGQSWKEWRQAQRAKALANKDAEDHQKPAPKVKASGKDKVKGRPQGGGKGKFNQGKDQNWTPPAKGRKVMVTQCKYMAQNPGTRAAAAVAVAARSAKLVKSAKNSITFARANAAATKSKGKHAKGTVEEAQSWVPTQNTGSSSSGSADCWWPGAMEAEQ